MKKKTKIILFSVIGVLVIAAVAVGLVFALNNSGSSATTGTMVEGKTCEGWHKNEAHIAFGETSSEKYYSRWNDDCVYNVQFKTGAKQTSKSTHKTVYRIEYDQDFHAFDDLYTCFVLTDGTNTYTTAVEPSETAIGSDWIDISMDDINENYYISEVWVRTED